MEAPPSDPGSLLDEPAVGDHPAAAAAAAEAEAEAEGGESEPQPAGAEGPSFSQPPPDAAAPDQPTLRQVLESMKVGIG